MTFVFNSYSQDVIKYFEKGLEEIKSLDKQMWYRLFTFLNTITVNWIFTMFGIKEIEFNFPTSIRGVSALSSRTIKSQNTPKVKCVNMDGLMNRWKQIFKLIKQT